MTQAPQFQRNNLTCGMVALCSLCLIYEVSFAQATGTVEIDFIEENTENQLPCRVSIKNDQGRPQRARGALFQSGWNLVESTLLFKGRAGDFTYRASHGPQFSAGSGGFTLDKNSDGYDVLNLTRHADLDSEGWIGGDLLSHLPHEKTRRWLPAEDLQMAVTFGGGGKTSHSPKPNDESWQRWVENSSYLDDRSGSGLVLHHWKPPAEVPARLPSSRLLVLAKEAQIQETGQNADALPVHAEIQRLWARDAPIWLASKRIDSIQILSNHLTHDGTGAKKFQAILDPDPGRFRGARGPGRLVEYLYWQVLETGLRIPPSAGSGFGKTPSPLGYNRVYARITNKSKSDWWKAVRSGNTFVTNGPLLRANINGMPPGSLFEAPQGGSIELDVGLTLTVSDPVEYLDVIFNGQKLYQARLDEYAKQGGKIPQLTVKESGWLVIRVVTERADTYRLATTAPYYCAVGDDPRISKGAVEFFQAWLEESAKQIASTDQSSVAAPYISAARTFWQSRHQSATVP